MPSFQRVAWLVLFAILSCHAPLATARANTGAVTQRLTSTQLATHVKGYYRKDGTYVRPHESRSPGAGSHVYRPPAAPHAPESYSPPRTYTPRAPKTYAQPRARALTPSYGPQRDEHGRFVRSQSAKDAFRRRNPCPCTGRISGPCPGYVIDHIKALKRGGADRPENMQWQSVTAAKAKDRWE